MRKESELISTFFLFNDLQQIVPSPRLRTGSNAFALFLRHFCGERSQNSYKTPVNQIQKYKNDAEQGARPLNAIAEPMQLQYGLGSSPSVPHLFSVQRRDNSGRTDGYQFNKYKNDGERVPKDSPIHFFFCLLILFPL